MTPTPHSPFRREGSTLVKGGRLFGFITSRFILSQLDHLHVSIRRVNILLLNIPRFVAGRRGGGGVHFSQVGGVEFPVIFLEFRNKTLIIQQGYRRVFVNGYRAKFQVSFS